MKTNILFAATLVVALCFLSCSPRSTTSFTADPKIWNDANAATLTLTIKGNSDTHLDPAKFPERDYRKKFNDNWTAMQEALKVGNWGLAYFLKVSAEYSELNADKQKGEVRIVFNIYRDHEQAWPKSTELLNMQIWGTRTPHTPATRTEMAMYPLLKYDFILTGSPQQDGVIKGTATGRFIVDSDAVDFANGAFELKSLLPDKK